MRTLLLLTLALPLTGCVVPKIVGDNPEATGKDEDDGGDATETDGPADSDAESGSPDTKATSEPDATGGAPDDTTSGAADTGQDGECAGLTAEACAANPACMPVLGESELSDDCKPGPQFLGCLPVMPCDSVILTVCDEETDEPFRLTDGCIPPGYVQCEGNGLPCGGGMGCEALGEADCEQNGCTVVVGAPHVEVDGEVCADYGAFEFLGCLPADTTCPPVIGIVCPEGQDAPAWDVPSGCNVAGFESCEEQLVPACE